MIKEKVSICVITYNSSKTVIETLDSILNQTYGSNNLELIIADDASKDDTNLVIDNWINQHKEKFYRVEFIKHQKNGGVSKNINSAWKFATCEWIKSIAGDDILHCDCILNNVSYVNENNECNIVFSRMSKFHNTIGDILGDRISSIPSFFLMTASEQYKFLQKRSIGSAPSAFIKKKLLESVGFADERFSLIEDFPLWFKVTQEGNKLWYLNKITVYYRISDSTSNVVNRLGNVNYLKQIINIDELLIYPTLNKNEFFYKYRKRKISHLLIKVIEMFDNKKTWYSYFIYKSIYCFKPFYIFDKLK